MTLTEDRKAISEVVVADHLQEGDVFSIFGLNGEAYFRVAKVIKARAHVLHLFVYDEKTGERLTEHDVDKHLIVPDEINRARRMSIAVSRKIFSLMRPLFIGSRNVHDLELSGYRQWCLTNGEIIGDGFRLEDELDENWRVYRKIFLMYGIPSFLWFLLCLSVHSSNPLYFPGSLLMGTTFGVVMVILQWSFIRRHRKTHPRKLSASSTQFTEVDLPVDYDTAFELGVRAIAEIKDCKPIVVDKRAGIIEARVASSLVQEGQELLLAFSRLDLHKTAVIVWSESIAGMHFDMGKNLANVNSIISHLKTSATPKESFLPDLVDNSADGTI